MESSPVDAVDVKKQLETNAEEPASVTPLENAILVIYSFITYLTTTVSLTYIASSDRSIDQLRFFIHRPPVCNLMGS